MDVVDAIVRARRGPNDRPLSPVTINEVRIREADSASTQRTAAGDTSDTVDERAVHVQRDGSGPDGLDTAQDSPGSGEEVPSLQGAVPSHDTQVESFPATGEWRGSVKQFLVPRYSVVFSLQSGESGSHVGTIEYPEAGCAGDLVLLKVTPEEVRVSETITRGRCISGGTIVISKIRSDAADWAWYNRSGRRQATSRITRRERRIR
jgi:hypothetical protein